MKYKKGDKIVLLCVKSVYGVDFNAIIGKLVNVRRQKWSTNKIVTIKAKHWYFIVGDDTMNNKVMDLPLDVWTIKPWNDETRAEVKKLRASCVVMAQNLRSFGNLATPKTTA